MKTNLHHTTEAPSHSPRTMNLWRERKVKRKAAKHHPNFVPTCVKERYTRQQVFRRRLEGGCRESLLPSLQVKLGYLFPFSTVVYQFDAVVHIIDNKEYQVFHLAIWRIHI